MARNKHLYMAVTPDEYELPLYVSDSASDLARAYGLKPVNVLSSISHNRDGHITGRKFIRIDIDDEETSQSEPK